MIRLSRLSRLRRSVIAAGTLALAAALAGCVGIPTSGDVQTVQIVAEPDELPGIALPEGPQAGQSQEDLLLGFLRAGRGPQGEYSVARQFLAPGTEWSGTDRVLISGTTISPVRVAANTWSITLNVQAEVDARGRYIAGSSQQTLSYEFVEVDGEQRISAADPGTVLTSGAFASAFEAYPLSFFDPSFEYLVPDLRWFPRTRSVADRIVDELTIGPSPWLQPGVVATAFPDGTTATAQYLAPRVDVDLSAGVRTESARAQRRMMQQIEQSLAALSNVTVVSITADGLSLAPAAEGVPPESQYVVGEVIGGTEAGFGRLGGTDGITPLPTIGTRVNALEPDAATLSRDRDAVAVLGTDGVSLVTGSGAPILVDGRSGLIAPTIDPYGYVWSVPARNPGALRATGADEVVHDIRLSAEGRVVSLELSRDGARLLVGLVTAEGSQVLTVGVQRDADLAPVALATPSALPVDGELIDAAWVDGVSIAILRSGEAGPTVDVVGLGGPTDRLGPVDGGMQIVGGNLQEGLRVLTDTGAVLRPSGTGGWVDTGFVASFLGTQQ